MDDTAIGMSEYLAHTLEVNWFVVGTIWLALVLGGIGYITAVARTEWSRLVWFFFILLLALGIRSIAVSATLMHENGYGYMLFSEIAAGEPVRDVYGLGYFALHLPFFRLFGAYFSTLFAVQIILSSLVAATALLLLSEFEWGLLPATSAGMLIAVHPVLVRFGASESMFVAAYFFMLSGGLFAILYMKKKQTLYLMSFVSFLFLSTQVRPEFYIVAPLFVFVFGLVWLLESSIKYSFIDSNLVKGILFGVFLFAIPVHNFIYRLLEGNVQTLSLVGGGIQDLLRLSFNINLRPFEAGNITFSPLFSGWALVGITFAGALYFLYKWPRYMLLTIVPVLVGMYLWVPIQNAPWVSARLQQTLLLMWLLLAGIGAGLLVYDFIHSLDNRDSKHMLNLVVALLFGFILWGGLSRIGFVNIPHNPDYELKFLRQTMALLPPDSTIFIPRGDRIVNSFFPDGHELLRSKRIVIKRLPHDMKNFHPTSKDMFYWGLVCYEFANANEATSSVRNECLQTIRRCGTADSNATTTFPNRPRDFLYVPANNITLSFFRCR